MAIGRSKLFYTSSIMHAEREFNTLYYNGLQPILRLLHFIECTLYVVPPYEESQPQNLCYTLKDREGTP